MNSETRVLLILATAAGAAVLVVALGAGPWQGAPVLPPTVAEAPAESQEVPPNLVAELSPSTPIRELAAAASDIERTEVAVSPSAGTVLSGGEERVRLRAAVLAKRLELSAAGEQSLTAVLLEEQSRRERALTELRRKPDDVEVKDRVRAELDKILAWKTKELDDQFGAVHAAEIMARR